MRHHIPNWLSMSAPDSEEEEELPPPQDLIPLSHTLITHHLALAFDIRRAKDTVTSTPSPELGSGTFDVGEDEPPRTLKRPRLVWTPQLHKRFVDAVAHLGIKNAVPKTIMQLMSVEGLTRENVASHLQKYRLYLRRMQQGLSAGNTTGGCHVSDPATDHLFARSERFMQSRTPVAVAVAHHRLQPLRLVYVQWLLTELPLESNISEDFTRMGIDHCRAMATSDLKPSGAIWDLN